MVDLRSREEKERSNLERRGNYEPMPLPRKGKKQVFLKERGKTT